MKSAFVFVLVAVTAVLANPVQVGVKPPTRPEVVVESLPEEIPQIAVKPPTPEILIEVIPEEVPELFVEALPEEIQILLPNRKPTVVEQTEEETIDVTQIGTKPFDKKAGQEEEETEQIATKPFDKKAGQEENLVVPVSPVHVEENLPAPELFVEALPEETEQIATKPFDKKAGQEENLVVPVSPVHVEENLPAPELFVEALPEETEHIATKPFDKKAGQEEEETDQIATKPFDKKAGQEENLVLPVSPVHEEEIPEFFVEALPEEIQILLPNRKPTVQQTEEQIGTKPFDKNAGQEENLVVPVSPVHVEEIVQTPERFVEALPVETDQIGTKPLDKKGIWDIIF